MKTIRDSLFADLEATIEEKVAEQENSIKSSVRNYVKWAKEAKAKLRTNREEVEKVWRDRYEILTALLDAGFTEIKESRYGPDFTVTVIDEAWVTEISRITGAMDPDQTYKTIESEEEQTIRVDNTPKRYPFVTVRFVRKLRDTDPCKIVKTERTELMCGARQ